MTTYTQEQVLRDVSVDGYRLQTWDTYQVKHGKCMLAYRFTAPNGAVLFEGEDFGCSPMDAIDSDASLRGLLGFLTCRPGDTDPEYFDSYTEAQLAFANGDAEQLQVWALDEQDGEQLPQFVDWSESS